MVDALAIAQAWDLLGFVRAWAFEDDPADPVAAAQATYVISSDGGRGPGANLKPRDGRA